MVKHRKAIAAAVLAIAVLAVFLGSGWFSGWLSSLVGYHTAFQGLQAEFHSVYWQNQYWSSTEKGSFSQIEALKLHLKGPPSALSFGYELAFDPDVASDGWCDLRAAQQPMVIVEDDYKPWTWTVGNTQFEVHKVKLEWCVNVWLSGSREEAAIIASLGRIAWEPNYANSQIWLKLTPRLFRYFEENPEQLFIAPAYIGVAKVEWASIDENNKITLNDPDVSEMDISPGAVGETFGIYYSRGGAPVDVQQEIGRFYYQGLALDPQVFRREYWIKIDLANFKPVNRVDYLIWHHYKYPSVKLTLQVYVFVVGVWKVQLREGDVPTLQPHKPAGDWRPDPITGFFKGVADWFGNPLNLLQLWLLLIIIAVVVLALTAPWLLKAAYNAVKSAGKGVKKLVKRKRRGR